MEFEVTPDVLIPRPETELLVEAARSVCFQPCSGTRELWMWELVLGALR